MEVVSEHCFGTTFRASHAIEMKKTVRVVAAAIIRGGKILAAQRPPSGKEYKSLKWEFPGGKIEPGETETEAIQREIKEELGCKVEVEALLPEIEHEYPDFIIQMTLCVCRIADGSEPECLEHNALRFVAPEELPSLDWAAADARCYPLLAPFLLNL